MTTSLFLVWLISILSASTMGGLTNEKLDLIQHAYSVAIMQGIDPYAFLALAECESRWNQTARGDYRSEDKTYLAYGIYQFHKATFNGYKKLYGLEYLKYEDPYDQTWLAAQIIKKDKRGWGHWENCRNQHLASL